MSVMMSQRRRCRIRAVPGGCASLAVALAVAGCSSNSGARVDDPGGIPVTANTSPAVQVRTVGPSPGGRAPEAPPPFRLSYPGQELVLRPYTWCYEAGCVDGAPIDDPPSVGSPATILVDVPTRRWQLLATFTPAGQPCGRQQTVEPTRVGDGRFQLRPAGHADSYDVTLFAHGGGDMSATFRWTTPADGPLPTPAARLALIAEHDGHPDSYGVELAVDNLATTPDAARATIEVTASNGRNLTFTATRATGRCRPPGSLYFDGPDDRGTAAADLGSSPFEYDVTLDLDGGRYRGQAMYPRDIIRGDEPSVRLTFDPPLPAPR